MENLSLKDVSNLPEHRAAVLWTKAQQILDAYPADELSRASDGESHYVITPPVSHSRHYHSNELSWMSFSIAALVNSADAREIPAGSPTYLLINGNYHSPQLQFDRYNPDSPVSLPNVPGAKLEDESLGSLINDMLNKANEAKRQREQRQERELERSRARRKAVSGGLAAVGTVAAIVVGIGQTIEHFNNQEKQEIAEFDNRNLLTRGDVVSAGEIGFAGSQSQLFSEYEIPELDGAILESPRRFEITVGECEVVGTVDPATEVSAGTNGPNESVMIAVDSAGNIQACALNPYEDDPGDYPSDYEVAIQSRTAA